MANVVLKKGKQTYEFLQYDDEPGVCYVIGEEADWNGIRGVTRCIFSQSGDKDWGNGEYMRLRKLGFQRVQEA